MDWSLSHYLSTWITTKTKNNSRQASTKEILVDVQQWKLHWIFKPYRIIFCYCFKIIRTFSPQSVKCVEDCLWIAIYILLEPWALLPGSNHYSTRILLIFFLLSLLPLDHKDLMYMLWKSSPWISDDSWTETLLLYVTMNESLDRC